ncbi:ABC transporter permease [Desulfoferrobacter suflitae]|uniref:ABC transporter permease n=1 Tax=Desulfoferrobacter suflitae TaxID=2865782 RepID=UPI00216480D9|nr:FtsX-like permease family protein [Desulfoferrobacter suflitae]MCK8602964.1 FtsX-like permease family protein [Desulfoferrobacter suflitae]
MKTSVERQVVLPWNQVVRISFNSIKARFFRSLITTLTLTLAVAFVAFTWSSYDMLNAIWPHADKSLQDLIASSGYELTEKGFGSSPKDIWLAILSVLVCVVGIINAQLMAVTERFREIGTIKCLGALDSFVVRIFLLEAVYQGLLGGVSGSVLGVLVATLSLLWKFGFAVVYSWPFQQMLSTIGWASGLAVFLSLIGVIYPALVAAKMQPAVALRAEE